MEQKNWKELPYISIALVLINVIVFVICEHTGDVFYRLGTLNVEGVLKNREYGRFIWSMFLHVGFDHIFNNMVILYFMGTMIEKEIGHLPYTLVYFLSGIGGGLFSLYVKVRSHSAVGSVGASGALFGLDGLLLAMVLFYDSPIAPVTPLRVLLMIGLSLYNGFAANNVDNAGHLGGLLVGLIMGALLCTLRRRKSNAGRDSHKKEDKLEY